LAKLAEDAESQEYLDVVEQAEPEVDELAGKIAENLNINFLLLMTTPDLVVNKFCVRAPCL
jgi:hypothetical protein